MLPFGRNTWKTGSEMLTNAPAFVIWLTGIPAAGKTTIARGIATTLGRRGRAVQILDGDELRRAGSADLGFSRADRAENVRRAAERARAVVDEGDIAVVALVSPYEDARQQARELVLPALFLEVHVDCPVDVAAARDPKGLYRRALGGQLADFTGVSAPYEAPTAPDLLLQTARVPVARCLEQLLALLEGRGLLSNLRGHQRMKVVGLQRSGTNYVEHLLRRNVADEVLHQNWPWWKHALPRETRDIPRAAPHWDEWDAAPHMQVVLVSKSPYAWWLSLGRDPQDLFAKRPEIEPTIASCMAFYLRYHSAWLAEPVSPLRYEAVLASPAGALLSLPVKQREQPFCDTQRTAYNWPDLGTTFSLARKESYLTPPHGLSPALVREISNALDREIIERLGYELL